MLEIAICDDESVMREGLSVRLAEYMKDRQNTAYHVQNFEDGSSLLESDCDFDLIFLDIQMERPDGMETARRLRRQKNRSLLVFVTVLKERVFDAFEVEAYDYLVKPLDDEHFKRTMDRVIKTLERQADKSVLVQKRNSCQVIPLSQIVYCEVFGRKIYIHQENGEVVDFYDKMEKLEKQVDGRFFRCHRSYLVNLDFIRGCDAGWALLPKGEKIPVSRLRGRELTQALLCHMKRRNT